MRIAFFLFLLLILTGCSDPVVQGSAPAGPNVLLIVVDTVRGDRCSVNGYSSPTTPQLERLGAEGAVFRNAWSPAGWTGPAHASLFTGLRPENHGYLSGTRHEYLRPTVTLAKRFTDAGYRTASFSNNFFVSREFGLDQGFELVSRDFDSHDHTPYPYAAATHGKALDWIRKTRDEGQRFFLFVNDIEPHFEYVPTPPFEKAFMPAEYKPEEVKWARELPLRSLEGHLVKVVPLSDRTLEVLNYLYDAEIAMLDAELGGFLESVRRLGVLDNTIVVIVGDHGENIGDHGMTNHIGSLHRSIRYVPLVVRYPPLFKAGTVVDDVVRLEDLHPTLLAACGLPVPDGIDGVSLLSDLPGRVARAAYGPPHTFVSRMRKFFPRDFDSLWLRAEIRAVFDGRWHFMQYSDGRMELYDIPADPLEKNDLSGKEPAEVERLSALLTPFDRPPPPPDAGR